MIKKSIKKFFELEASTGILLAIATIFALLIANSEESEIYNSFLAIKIPLNFEFIGYHKDLNLQEWVNDALMAVFFFLVGLELKKELRVGELSSISKVTLPAFAALGGIIGPVIIFYLVNRGIDENMRGFAIPMATDIAFAYGMLCMFGKRINNSAKIFLVALAVIDDLAAILIIAIFYTNNLNVDYLLISSFALLGLLVLNLKKVSNIVPYILFGIFLWLAILKSGVHATVAGVVLAMFIPVKVGNKEVLENLAHKIAPGVNFFILPIFAFVNAGVAIGDFSLKQIISEPLILGIAAGLFFGKQIGVMFASLIAIKFKLANLPRGTRWLEFYGVSIFTGIGFTMSLFIGSLAFVGNNLLLDEVKIGVLLGSLLSLIYGTLVTFVAIGKSKQK